MVDQKNMNINYNEIKAFQPTDRNKELSIARKFQKKLFLSKVVYAYAIVIVLLGLCEKYLTFKLPGIAWGWIFGLFVILGFYSIISTIILGECPYCHRFQKLNGKAVGIDGKSVFYSNGVSPFISQCNRCGAPLSEKAVNEFYDRHKDKARSH